MWWSPPNGSRLSCGASAGRRKRPVLLYVSAGAQTSASFESRHWQLQALLDSRRRTSASPQRERCGYEPAARPLPSEVDNVAPTTQTPTVNMQVDKSLTGVWCEGYCRQAHLSSR